jgi:DNA-directed RNA polymerase subunit E"
MPKEKACKLCNKIYDGDKCPNCGAKEFVEGFKGRTFIVDPEKSEIAKKLNISAKGAFAVKTR